MLHADLDQLAALLDGLARDQASLEQLADERGRDLALLHERWDGAAATAHVAAQADWDAGFAAMRSALTSMRDVVTKARDNYVGAAETNLAMWKQVS